jgi:hypothetical protein
MLKVSPSIEENARVRRMEAQSLAQPPGIRTLAERGAGSPCVIVPMDPIVPRCPADGDMLCAVRSTNEFGRERDAAGKLVAIVEATSWPRSRR